MEITEILDKQMLSIKISKRKKPISLEVYERPTKTLFERIEKRDIFAHMFLVLDCCLMKRAGNRVNAKMNYINFHGDCLVFDFAKYKVHKNGEKYFGPWHVYKNPSKLWLYSVLSLLQYLF